MSKNNYFKGWYFKCSTNDKTIAFITAYHRSNKKESASLQIITEKTAFCIPFDFIKYSEKPLCVKLGECEFSEKGIKLNIKTDELTVTGRLLFYDLTPIKYDIMGPFFIVPFMQCKHGIYSMRHLVDGQITVNGRQFDFCNGQGYIEGDRGRSFPDRYIWTQCCFENNSLMLSVADIPFCGFSFTGIIGIVLLCKKEYRLATYLGAKIKYLDDNTVCVCQGDYELTAGLIKKHAHPLYAPTNGIMNRIIHESASCTAYYKFCHKGKLLCEFVSSNASFEFEYANV